MNGTERNGGSGWLWAGAGCGCLLLMLLAGIALGAAAWFWHAHRGGQQALPLPEGVPGMPSVTEPADGLLAAYAGTWLVADGDPAEPTTIYLRVEGNRISGTDHRGESTIDLRAAGGDNLAGAITAEGQTVPCTAQISADHALLILTLAPPASEYYTVVLRRQ